MSAFNNDIIITIGRMNPPTTGHMKLIEQMVETALETNVKKIYIILSGTLHKDTDPIKCVDKQKLLVNFIIDKVKNNIIEKQKYTNTQINEIDVNIICMDDPRINANNSIMQTIKFIIKESNTSKIQLIIGKDRATSYKWIKKYIEPVELNDEPIVVNRNSKDSKGQEKEGMSATKMRKLARDGLFDEFSKEMIPTGIDAKNIKEIYDTIRDPNIPESSKSRKTKRTSESTEKKTKKTRAGKKTYKKKRIINK